MTQKEIIDFRIQHHRTSLAEQCRDLSAHLLHLAIKLESDKPHVNLCVCELGEVQSKGTIIDAQCGRLMGKIDVWSVMEDWVRSPIEPKQPKTKE